jgi:amino acid permease
MSMRHQQQHQRPHFLVLMLLPILLALLVQVLSSTTTSSVNALSLTRRSSSSSSKIQAHQTKLKRQQQQRHKGRRTGRRSSSSSSQLEFSSSSKTNNNSSTSNDDVGSTTGKGGTATVPEEIFNLIKSIIGAGVLSLPAGIAVLASSANPGGSGNNVSSHRMLLSSSFLLIALMGTISAYTFSLIARVCHMTNTTTYADCWAATMKDRATLNRSDSSKGSSSSSSSSSTSLLGSIGAFIVALASTLDCFAGNLTYSMVLADTFRELLFSVLGGGGGVFAAIATKYASRSNVLLALTVLILLPLCLINNLSSLAPFSLVGILGMVYTGIVIGVRYFDGSYKLPNGKFLKDLSGAAGNNKALPSFATAASTATSSSPFQFLFNPKSLILISILSTAYIAHFNAPKFYNELKEVDTSSTTSSKTKTSFSKQKRFHIGVVTTSFIVSILFYGIVSALGYSTFGLATNAMILNNYSTNDVLISISRFCVGISLLFSYPLLFVGLKSGAIDLINQMKSIRIPQIFSSSQKKKSKHIKLQTPQQLVVINQQKHSNNDNIKLTVLLLSIVTLLAAQITDLTFVASMSGALLGTSLIFICPTIMFRIAIKNQVEKSASQQKYTKTQTFERTLCSIICIAGVCLAGIGSKMAWTA